MSRSYRKPWLKDPAARKVKRIHARRYRRHVKQVIQAWMQQNDCYWEGHYEIDMIDPISGEGYYEYVATYQPNFEEPVFKHKVQITHPYDLCDWIWYAPENPKYRRK